MKTITIILLCLMFLPTAGFCVEMLVNGDFEWGGLRGVTPKYWQPEEMAPYPMELPPGWIEAGPKTIKGWQGGDPVPVQFFNTDAPMYIHEICHDNLGTRSIKRSGVARDIATRDGYSIGWTLSGTPAQGSPWISQMLRVPPGKYTVNVTWNAMARNQSDPNAKRRTGGVLMLNVDRDVERCEVPRPVLSHTTWHEESQGKWLGRSIVGWPLETKTGFVEIRLGFVEKSTLPIPVHQYSYAAFDNVTIEFLPTAE